MVDDAAGERAPLSLVHVMHGGYDVHRVTHVVAHGDQRRHVLGKARAAIPHAGKEKGVPDPRVRPDTTSHLLDVRSESLTESGDLVHKGYLGREHGVRRILRHLGAGWVHHQDPLTLTHKRAVEFFHNLNNGRLRRADHNTVRLGEVLDRGAFLQKLGVRDVIERMVGLGRDRLRYLDMRTDGDGALHHHNAIPVHRPADGFCNADDGR